VIALNIDAKKVEQINNDISPIADKKIEEFLQNKSLTLQAILDKHKAYIKADYIIIATPTDYDSDTNYYNTQSVESVIKDVIAINPNAVMIIKSTAPVAYTQRIKEELGIDSFIFNQSFSEKAKRLIKTTTLLVLTQANYHLSQKSL